MLRLEFELTKTARNREPFHLKVKRELDINSGIIGVFGKSGCGKSSLLRSIAGLEEIVGTIELNGNCTGSDIVQNPAIYQSQKSTLFPHLSVLHNLKLVERDSAWKDKAVSLQQAISLCNIDYLLDRDVKSLSGGESQRVNLARTLLSGKPLLLLDEPFSANDWQQKQQLLQLLNDIKSNTSLNIILVSHSLTELASCCDTLVHMEDGRIIDVGQAQLLVRKLSQQQQQAFTVLNTRLVKSLPEYGLNELALVGSKDKTLLVNQALCSSDRFQIFANKVSIAKNRIEDVSVLNQLEGMLGNCYPKQHSVLVEIDIDGQLLLADVSRLSFESMSLQPGQRIVALFKAV